jgi:hypothetical protein
MENFAKILLQMIWFMVGDNRANLLINNIFPCRGYVVAWQYYRIIPRYAGYVGIWRQVNDLQFRLIGKTELPITSSLNILA